jgi:hypothetical protein
MVEAFILGAVYSLFHHGAYMQPMKFTMRWKCIKGSDVMNYENISAVGIFGDIVAW